MAIVTVRIPSGLIPAVIDSVQDRIENLTDLIETDYAIPTEERDSYRRLVADLEAVVVELDDPGVVTWKEDER